MRVELGFDNSLCLVAATAGICDNFRRLGLGRRFSRSAYFNALRRACKTYIASSTACSSSI